jgi:hypothetical protein
MLVVQSASMLYIYSSLVRMIGTVHCVHTVLRRAAGKSTALAESRKSGLQDA